MIQMGAIVAVLIGLAIAVSGFLVMRNPMRLSMLAPREEGYYQRAFFDASPRNSARAFGMMICLFGGAIATEGLASIFKTRYLQAAASGLWSLMGLTFVFLWCFGIAHAIWNATKGKPLDGLSGFEREKRALNWGPSRFFPRLRLKCKRKLFCSP